jgi:hypothetical protein
MGMAALNWYGVVREGERGSPRGKPLRVNEGI